MELLFSYGTLQQKYVQVANFGRGLSGFKDFLSKYVIEEIKIIDELVIKKSGKNRHPILRYTGNMKDQVIGTVFKISRKELSQADNYETDQYQRISAELKSGRACWIYVATNESK
ncbi:gamma-glutamylcyclotransferase family protein [uncultured Microbulbifer sp.]|uniref:gamma-glutamylcyclotransferase family protein n=1 Tax=uncultured Microbulbifer sp. TaxID=348147 RepID=UPI00260F2D8D|nr:gamma-glutamylcyclotransferase family protein [uncultured Microbulbifer sp.]